MSLVRATNADDAAASATAANPHVGHGRECSWSVENDARRPATKQLVEGLHTKIQILEAEIAQLKGKPGVSVDSDHEPLSPFDNKVVFPPDRAEPSASEHERLEPPSAHVVATAMYRYIFDIDANIPASDQPKDVHLSLGCQWDRHLPQLPHFTRLEHDTILSRCFKYGVSWLHCMLPETFLHDMLCSLTTEPSTVGDQLRLQHYTPMLHCALLAYASAFSDSPEVRSPQFRARFAQYAKRWLDFEFGRPTMGLVRALALLAEYHCGIGERGAGYMYMGMSIRAARALILPDGELWINEGASVLPGLVERDWHFWSAFCQDKLMALEFRERYELLSPHLGVSLPSVDTELDNRPWSDGLAGFLPRLVTKTFFESCKLMVISARVIEVMDDKYQVTQDERSVINVHIASPSSLSASFGKLLNTLSISSSFGDSQKRVFGLFLIACRSGTVCPLDRMTPQSPVLLMDVNSTLDPTSLQLDTWFNNLPRELLVWARSTSPLPHIIALHICYWFLIVCLHQPFYYRFASTDDDKAKAPSVANESSGQGDAAIHDLSIKMVDRATHKIVQLIQMFEEQHGMMYFPRNMVHVIYECGMALLKEAASVPSTATKKRATALEAVSACSRALRGSSRTWPWAEQLASQLDENLKEAGASIIVKPFASEWFAPWGDQTGQASYPLIQVWDLTRSSSMNQPPEMPAVPGGGPSTGILGLELSPSQHQAFGNPVIRATLGERARSADITDGATGVYDAVSFSGTPSSSTGSYSLPQQNQPQNNEDIWDHSPFQ